MNVASLFRIELAVKLVFGKRRIPRLHMTIKKETKCDVAHAMGQLKPLLNEKCET